eukprot:Skav234368  [mRNA]  locus=scaffold2071:38895:40157:+ [translate_table: standard]
MTLPLGSLGYIDYGERPRVVHVRLIVGHVRDNEYIIVTPDHDLYSEVLSVADNPDIVNFWPGPGTGAIPPGVPARSVYGFAPLSVAELTRFMFRGNQEAERMRAALGIAPDAAAPPAPAGGAAGGIAGGDAGAADAGGVERFWVLAEMVTGKKIGERVVPLDGHPIDGGVGLMRIADADGVEKPRLIHRVTEAELSDFCDGRIAIARLAEACEGTDRSAGEDARTLAVKYGFNGERHRSFRESVKELQQTDFEDFPLEPRTALDYVRAVSQIAESATAQHHMRVNSSGVPPGDRSVHEDQLLARVLDAALCYDSLNISNLACIELICRRRQLIADAHSSSPSQPSYLGAEYYLGDTYKSGGGIVTPALTDYVSRKMQAQSQILKEKRKLAEASGGKGAKGKPSNPPKAPPQGKPSGGAAQ